MCESWRSSREAKGGIALEPMAGPTRQLHHLLTFLNPSVPRWHAVDSQLQRIAYAPLIRGHYHQLEAMLWTLGDFRGTAASSLSPLKPFSQEGLLRGRRSSV